MNLCLLKSNFFIIKLNDSVAPTILAMKEFNSTYNELLQLEESY